MYTYICTVIEIAIGFTIIMHKTHITDRHTITKGVNEIVTEHDCGDGGHCNSEVSKHSSPLYMCHTFHIHTPYTWMPSPCVYSLCVTGTHTHMHMHACTHTHIHTLVNTATQKAKPVKAKICIRSCCFHSSTGYLCMM